MSNQPYIGLRPFERDETDIFFGREQHSDELINRLGSQHFLAVIGTSGCGKSSLVKTGLIAGLEAGYLASVGTHWRIVELRPGQQPFRVLAQKLLQELGEVLEAHFSAESLEQQLKQGSLSLHELLAEYPLPDNAQLLIVCDQFEEIFRFKQQSEAEAKNFVSLLLASSKPYPLKAGKVSESIFVVMTMRSDFLGDCAQFTGLAEAINSGLYLTPRLDEEQLRSAIEEPAFVFGGEVEPALVTQLLEDAQHSQDQLPLLQHILMRLWDTSDDKIIRLADYQNEKIQSLQNALSIHADEVLAELNTEQQAFAKQIFCRLTYSEVGKKDTRNPTKVKDLLALTGLTLEQLADVLKPFRQAGRCFLMPPLNLPLTEDSLIDISHESLIRQWQTLQKWVTEEAQAAQTYRHLLEGALRYRNQQVGLMQDPELGLMLKWWADFKPALEWANRYGRYVEDFPRAENFLFDSQEAKQQKLLQEERERQEKEQARQERELLQKKANSILKVSLSGAVLTVVGLVASTGWYYYAYMRETVVYCNASAKRFGVLQCVSEISESEVKSRPISYQFIRKGNRNPIHKVRAINNKKECTDNHSIFAYLETEKRNQSDVEKENQKILKECQWDYIYDEKGNIVYEKAFDENNKLVWGLVYSPHNKGEPRSQAFFVGEDGYPQPTKNSRTEFIKLEYSEDGDEISISYFDRKGKAQLKNYDNYHKIEKKYDNKGNPVEVAFFDLNGNPLLIEDGFHRYTDKYDDRGNKIEQAYFGLNNEPILMKKTQYHKLNFKYDDRGNIIEAAYFGLNNEPISISRNGYHKIVYKYDAEGNQLEESYFDKKNNPILIYKGNYHKIIYKYDNKGNKTEEAYFDLKNHPVLANKSTDFYYDEQERLIEESFNASSFHKISYKYDEKDNEIEEAYFGLKEEAILISEGYHKINYEYDNKDNEIEEAYFGLKGDAILTSDGYHKISYKYDNKDNQTDEAYFGVKDEAILTSDGYYKISYKYDDEDNQIEKNYFGLKNEPVLLNISLNSKGSYFYNKKEYEKAEKIFSEALKQFPNDLDLLVSDLKLALMQNNIVRFQQRLKAISPLLKPDKQEYAIIPFLNYLTAPQNGYQFVIKAINKLDKNAEITWDFSDMQPAIDRQNPKVQKIARLFMDYFEKRIDLKALKTKLAELEKTK